MLALAGVLAATAAAQSSSSGRLLFATGGDGRGDRLELAVVDPETKSFRRLTRQRPTGSDPVWRSDGRAILFAVSDSFTGLESNWEMGVNGARPVRLPGDIYDAAPSPNGRLVALLTDRGVSLVNRRGGRVRFLRLPLLRDDVHDGPPLWSPDGRWLAVFVSTETDKSEYGRVFVVRTDGRSRARALSPRVNGRDEFAEAWSPRGTRLAISRPGGLYVVNPDGSHPRRVAGARGPAATTWAPDGRRLAYVGKRGGIYVTGIRAPRRIARTVLRGRALTDVGVSWSPAGTLIAYTDKDGIYVVRPDGSGKRRVAAGERGMSVPSWSPRGRSLTYSLRDQIFVVRLKGARRPQTILPSTWDDSPTWSPDGSRIAFGRGTAAGLGDPEQIHVYVMDSNGGAARAIARGYGPSWAPDGRRLAFVDVLPAGRPHGQRGAGRIIVADTETNTQRQVAIGTAPAWSPDGRQLAFMRYSFAVDDKGERRISSSTLFVVGADGSGAHEILSTKLSECEPIYADPAWSPDGSSIALIGLGLHCDGGPEPDARITIVDPATGIVRKLQVSANELSWSRDGQSLAYASEEIGVVRATGADHRVLVRGGGLLGFVDPRWSPDGRRIAYIHHVDRDPRPDSWDVYVINTDGTGRTRLTRTAGVEGALEWSSK